VFSARQHTVIHWNPTAKARVRSQDIPFAICDGKLALDQALFQNLQFCPVNMIPETIYTELHLNTALIRRTSWGSLGTFKHSSVLWNIGEHQTAQGKTTFRQVNKG
jgi:hypothetical protein